MHAHFSRDRYNEPICVRWLVALSLCVASRAFLCLPANLFLRHFMLLSSIPLSLHHLLLLSSALLNFIAFSAAVNMASWRRNADAVEVNEVCGQHTQCRCYECVGLRKAANQLDNLDWHYNDEGARAIEKAQQAVWEARKVLFALHNPLTVTGMLHQFDKRMEMNRSQAGRAHYNERSHAETQQVSDE